MTKILAIETSCDETAISIVEFLEDGSVNILAQEISSQVEMHKEWGGVVPNIAKREHAKNLVPILEKTLRDAKLFNDPIKSENKKDLPENELSKILEREPELLEKLLKLVPEIGIPEIDAIAVTQGPGLEPALWVGVNFAKSLALVWDKPVIPTNHMEGHIYSALLNRISNFKFQILKPEFPALALLISGGHTEIIEMDGWSKYRLVGKTRDDAVGEAFDKVARILGLPYPGGPEISKLAEIAEKNTENFSDIEFPRPMISSGDLDFSFSGLKTSVLYKVKKIGELTEDLKAEIAYQFENAVTDVIVKKVKDARDKFSAKSLIVGGGVIANKRIRKALSEIEDLDLYIPDMKLTTDNATMIAIAGYYRLKAGQSLASDSTELANLKADGNLAVHG